MACGTFPCTNAPNEFRFYFGAGFCVHWAPSGTVGIGSPVCCGANWTGVCINPLVDNIEFYRQLCEDTSGDAPRAAGTSPRRTDSFPLPEPEQHQPPCGGPDSRCVQYGQYGLCCLPANHPYGPTQVTSQFWCNTEGGRWVSPSEYAEGVRCNNGSKGCCCATGCVNVPVSASCPAGCVAKPDATLCVPNDPACMTGCCHCSWCCDMPPSQCLALGGTPMAISCTAQTTKDACRAMRQRKPCVAGAFHKVRRDLPAGTAVEKRGRWELVSERTENSVDLPAGSNECGKIYTAKSRTTAGRWEGLLCNQPDRECSTASKVMQPMKKRRTANGRWEWIGAFHPPCSERPAVCVGGAVGC